MVEAFYTSRRSELLTGGADPPGMKLSCMLGRRRQRGRLLLGADKPVSEFDPGRLDHPRLCQGAVTHPEHAR
jgi:hypothetical protein